MSKKPKSLSSKTFKLTALAAMVGTMAFPAYGQDEKANVRKSTAETLLEIIEVTARKRSESIQETPLSVTALGEDQLDALKVRDFNDLSDGMANVTLDDIGSARGNANFSIRGLGINSSIPSIDPTVGVFVDGVFVGTNGGVIMDMFDLERIEVLRGPQGILFGRNVTGGALLLHTKKPGEYFEFKAKASVTGGGDGGLNKTVQAVMSFPITDDLATKVSVYDSNDDGSHTNLFDDSDHGAYDQTMFRSSTLWEPTEDLSVFLKLETINAEGDGPASQNHTNGSGIGPADVFGTPTFDRNTHDFSIDEPGYQTLDVDSAALNIDWEIAGGTATYIFGYREYVNETYGDIDATPIFFFHSASFTNSEQFSHELRFNTEIGSTANLTVGLYQYSNEMSYHERRVFPTLSIPGGIYMDGGGNHEVSNSSVFAAVDFDITDQLTAIVGARYTKEKKEVEISSLGNNVSAIQTSPFLPQGPTCNITLDNNCTFDFVDDDDWTSVSPKLGLTYTLENDDLLYTHWTKGFRSGGYNLRNSADISTPALLEANGPGPFDQETVSSFEIGYKLSRDWGNLNAALFHTSIDDMQREVNLPDGSSGVVQVIKNTAEATLMGFEVDGVILITDSLVANFNAGYINAEYDKVIYDLNNDGVVNSADEKLEIPRVPELTYSFGFSYDINIGDFGYLSSRINYSHRDETAYTDNNLGFINELNVVNAGFDLHTNDEQWVISLFGKNLTDEVKHGSDTQLSWGTFSPLAKGRIIGLEVTYTME